MSTEAEDRTQISSAQMYEKFFVPSMFQPFVPDLLERVDPRPGERVLDIACGTGIVTRNLPLLVEGGGTVAGLDFNPGMLEVARSIPATTGPSISWIESSAEDLAVEDASFDVVLCQQGLQFFGDRHAALHEMHRVLVPGGRVGIATWKAIEHQPFGQAINDSIQSNTGETATDIPFSLGDSEELRDMLEGAGFRDVTVYVATRPVHFPYSEQMIGMIIMAGAAVLPGFAAMSDADRQALVAAVAKDLEPTLQEFRVGDEIVSPQSTNIAVGHKPNLDA